MVIKYAQLEKFVDRVGYRWVMYFENGEESIGTDLSELEVLNKVGMDGWSVAFQINHNEVTGERTIMLQKKV